MLWKTKDLPSIPECEVIYHIIELFEKTKTER